MKWLQLDHKIIELERILGKYHLRFLLLHINRSLERSNEYTGVTQLVGGLGYVREQISSGLGFSPVLGALLNIHDNCCPQVVEPSGDRKKVVETISSGKQHTTMQTVNRQERTDG